MSGTGRLRSIARRTARLLAVYVGGRDDGLDEDTPRRRAELEPWPSSGLPPPWSDEPEAPGYAGAHAIRGTVGG